MILISWRSAHTADLVLVSKKGLGHVGGNNVFGCVGTFHAASVNFANRYAVLYTIVVKSATFLPQ